MKVCALFVLILALLTGICTVPVAAEDATGSDHGWFVIHCNIVGAKVYLDDVYVGTTTSTTLTVPVSTTGTPVKSLRVQKNGFSTFITSISRMPDKGGSVDLYATLNELPDTTQTSVGGDVGWYVVHCNIDGATVFFDDSDRGEISQGMVYVPVYSTGTPYKRYTVKKDGYTTYTSTIPNTPGKGETIDLYATLNPVATTITTAARMGGDVGWYAVHCNIDGATVTFDNDARGQTAQGKLTVQVYVTGTPYKTFTVYKSGYMPYTGTIDASPSKGETIDLYATLNAPAETTAASPTTTAQKSPVPAGVCGLAVVLAAGAVFLGVSRK